LKIKESDEESELESLL